MAKKKKRTTPRKAPAKRRSSRKAAEVPRHSVPSGFWKQVGASALIVLALLVILSWFNTGGPIPEWLHDFGMKAVGFTIFVLPPLLIYLGVATFRADSNRLPFVVKFAGALIVIWASGLFGLIKNTSVASPGGLLGEAANSAMLALVNPAVAVAIYILLIIITILFIFQVTPVALIRWIANLFKTDRTEEEQNVKIMKKAAQASKKPEREQKTDFKLNAGVPIMEHDDKTTPKKRSLGASAASSEKSVEPSALLAVRDPNWKGPELDLLEKREQPADPGSVKQNAEIIKDTLSEFNIQVEMEGANVGPKVTQYMLSPPSGVKLTKITQLETNIALNLAAKSLRIEAPIPGKKAVGIEVPNRKAADVRLRGIMESPQWKATHSPLAFAIGKDISGQAVVGELDKMPHLLVAGQTGSGKSVMINTLITSLLYHNSPSELKLILVDPKQVEMASYEDIPHLLTPIITESDKTVSALKWAVNEMERRYRQMAEVRVKNIKSYNAKIKSGGHKIPIADEEGNVQQHQDGSMPYIVIVIDEMADLMMMAKRDVEALIVRIAQKARAVGIHLVLATQRPSVNVITGLIKANVPARIAFTTVSQVDSITVLDQAGAEKLLGQGDMLFKTVVIPKPIRIQGAWVTDEEVGKITDHLRMQSPPQYNEEVISQPVQLDGKGGVVFSSGDSEDSMFDDAVRAVIESGKASTSYLQLRLKVGYQRAARIIAEMEEKGIVGPANGSRPREVLISSLDELEASEEDE